MARLRMPHRAFSLGVACRYCRRNRDAGRRHLKDREPERMKAPPIALLLAVLTASCTHTRVVKNAAPPATAAATVWDRQVRNAVDAGDGDVTLRKLREKSAAEPENVPARLELAQAYRDRGYHEVALEISRLAVARFPESGPAQLSLVRDLRAINRRPEAIASLETFL